MKFNILALLIAAFCITSYVRAEETLRIVAIGDSLTAGYGLPTGEDFVTQLETALQADGYNVEIENAGVSGDTTAGGLQRIDWAIGKGADFVILELGANDALRGIEPDETRRNLSQIIELIQQKDIPILLAGMRAPPNMGSEYANAFDQIFPDLASRYKTGYYPFFLEGVAADPALNQDDYIHPNAEGVKVIVGNMLPYVTEFIER
ncbi:arylesterase [Sneathiella sp. CAU 1612]|uniref:Arylesterase n=1 Tax=Sneathiella sedimenti TaxID=2816034 RepID=A0ABS3F0N8_9PROT|nr:arylesterase [Sneathiella sedimenti]MBO0332075.1 arylesterase [Sneathiella sedimenti]